MRCGRGLLPHIWVAIFRVRRRSFSRACRAVAESKRHGACQSAETLLNSRGEALRTGEWRPLLQGGLARHPDFPDVPFVIDYAKTPTQRQVLEFLYASQSFGRPYLAPPGLPPDRLAVLRTAFDKTIRDSNFLNDAARQKLRVSSISGTAMDQMIAELKTVPKEIVATVVKLTGHAGGN
jgi:tripartite-type tricarboxylate transporter receptor subunit TctC